MPIPFGALHISIIFQKISAGNWPGDTLSELLLPYPSVIPADKASEDLNILYENLKDRNTIAGFTEELGWSSCVFSSIFKRAVA